jgi:hypothetical protein
VTSRGRKDGISVNLGSYDNLWESFKPPCPLYRLFKSLLPDKPEDPAGDVYLIPARSLHRIEPDVAMSPYGSSRSLNFANMLFLGQRIQEEGQTRLQYCHEVLNAMSQEQNEEGAESMAVRKVDTIRPNINLIKQWVNHWQCRHLDTCKVMEPIQKKPSRLIDVVERRVVPCPQPSCEYLCLSYVWGTTAQRVRKDGSKLLCLPATIKDAIEFVIMMGKRYLWVDSVSLLISVLRMFY